MSLLMKLQRYAFSPGMQHSVPIWIKQPDSCYPNKKTTVPLTVPLIRHIQMSPSCGVT